MISRVCETMFIQGTVQKRGRANCTVIEPVHGSFNNADLVMLEVRCRAGTTRGLLRCPYTSSVPSVRGSELTRMVHPDMCACTTPKIVSVGKMKRNIGRESQGDKERKCPTFSVKFGSKSTQFWLLQLGFRQIRPIFIIFVPGISRTRPCSVGRGVAFIASEREAS